MQTGNKNEIQYLPTSPAIYLQCGFSNCDKKKRHKTCGAII